MSFRTTWLGLVASVTLAASAWALDTSKLQPQGYVNDFAHALDQSSAYALERYCATVEQATGVQIAIVTVDTLEDEPIEDVANRLFRQWGVGKKGKDDGLMLLLAIKDRKQRAEVGYGLEGVITDAYASEVLRGIRPILRQGNYGGALLAAAQQFGSKIAQDKGVAIANAPVQTTPAQRGDDLPKLLVVYGVITLVFIVIGKARGGRGGGYRGGGGAGSFLGGMILGDMLGRRGGGGWGGGGGSWGGGGFGGGGGGGFGGFGGGSSGGGGASGGW